MATRTHVMESRAYDAHFDATYTGPYNNPSLDPRVAAAISSTDMVSGKTRFKYFRRPIAPRMSAMPPNILLAPTKAQDPMVPVEEKPEPLTKNAEVQTAYRESEAQTQPYTPDYFVPEGEEPEVLMLKDLTFANGLPLGAKDLLMVEFARSKRILESSLPPVTDEASMMLRKRLMENQEVREFRMREAEIDRKREERLAQLQAAITERSESNELLASQRVDAIRQTRMEERDEALTKIRARRIKVLRALARKRNAADKQIYSGHERDIVADYFDKASEMYAPIRRQGKGVKPDPSKFDAALRMPPLDTLPAIAALEAAVPRSIIAAAGDDNRSFSPVKHMSKTEPLGIHSRIRASEDRMTSSGVRALRNTKRDIEEMHNILQRKKRALMLSAQQQLQQQGGHGHGHGHAAAHGGANSNRPHSRMPSAPSEPRLSSAPGSPGSAPRSSPTKRATSASARSGPAGRPRTPDLLEDPSTSEELAGRSLRAAVVLLQRLIRGRAVQNSMYEGRLRRAELIAELRGVDEAHLREVPQTPAELGRADMAAREKAIRSTTMDAIAGLTSTHLLSALSQEKARAETVEQMQKLALAAIEERHGVESLEAGRRQKEGLNYPKEFVAAAAAAAAAGTAAGGGAGDGAAP